MRDRMYIKTTEKSLSIKNEIGIQKTTKHTRWLFSILGMWFIISKDSTSFCENILSVIIIIFWQSILLFVIIPVLYYSLYHEKDIKIKIALAGPTGVAVSCLLKYYATLYQRNRIKQCIDIVKYNWSKICNRKDQEIMMKNTKKGATVTVLCATFMYVGGITHQIIVPFLPGTMLSELSNSTDRPLVYPVYHVLFNSQISPIYEFIYFSHIFLAVIVCTMFVGACNLGAVFITHLCGQIEILISKLNSLIGSENKKQNNKDLNKKMKMLIHLHNDTIDFTSNIEGILYEICLIEMVASSIIICLDEYYVIVSWRNRSWIGLSIYIILLISFCGNVFIFCYIGELLKEKISQIGTTVFMMDWHRLSRRNACAMILIIAMTQNSRKITAGGLLELSFNGFTSVIKTSVGCLNILRMIEF
uniref:Odorant receptor n=1 Tax=Aulacocentrum confusum TaxID=2767324 RepID=A0A7G8Z927_9HYME|nr:olfactory receptor 8 [Aulacocentrum confusum]